MAVEVVLLAFSAAILICLLLFLIAIVALIARRYRWRQSENSADYPSDNESDNEEEVVKTISARVSGLSSSAPLPKMAAPIDYLPPAPSWLSSRPIIVPHRAELKPFLLLKRPIFETAPRMPPVLRYDAAVGFSADALAAPAASASSPESASVVAKDSVGFSGVCCAHTAISTDPALAAASAPRSFSPSHPPFGVAFAFPRSVGFTHGGPCGVSSAELRCAGVEVVQNVAVPPTAEAADWESLMPVGPAFGGVVGKGDGTRGGVLRWEGEGMEGDEVGDEHVEEGWGVTSAGAVLPDVRGCPMVCVCALVAVPGMSGGADGAANGAEGGGGWEGGYKGSPSTSSRAFLSGSRCGQPGAVLGGGLHDAFDVAAKASPLATGRSDPFAFSDVCGGMVGVSTSGVASGVRLPQRTAVDVVRDSSRPSSRIVEMRCDVWAFSRDADDVASRYFATPHVRSTSGPAAAAAAAAAAAEVPGGAPVACDRDAPGPTKSLLDDIALSGLNTVPRYVHTAAFADGVGRGAVFVGRASVRFTLPYADLSAPPPVSRVVKLEGGIAAAMGSSAYVEMVVGVSGATVSPAATFGEVCVGSYGALPMLRDCLARDPASSRLSVPAGVRVATDTLLSACWAGALREDDVDGDGGDDFDAALDEGGPWYSLQRSPGAEPHDRGAFVSTTAAAALSHSKHAVVGEGRTKRQLLRLRGECASALAILFSNSSFLDSVNTLLLNASLPPQAAAAASGGSLDLRPSSSARGRGVARVSGGGGDRASVSSVAFTLAALDGLRQLTADAAPTIVFAPALFLSSSIANGALWYPFALRTLGPYYNTHSAAARVAVSLASEAAIAAGGGERAGAGDDAAWPVVFAIATARGGIAAVDLGLADDPRVLLQPSTAAAAPVAIIPPPSRPHNTSSSWPTIHDVFSVRAVDTEVLQRVDASLDALRDVEATARRGNLAHATVESAITQAWGMAPLEALGGRVGLVAGPHPYHREAVSGPPRRAGTGGEGAVIGSTITATMTSTAIAEKENSLKATASGADQADSKLEVKDGEGVGDAGDSKDTNDNVVAGALETMSVATLAPYTTGGLISWFNTEAVPAARAANALGVPTLMTDSSLAVSSAAAAAAASAAVVAEVVHGAGGGPGGVSAGVLGEAVARAAQADALGRQRRMFDFSQRVASAVGPKASSVLRGGSAVGDRGAVSMMSMKQSADLSASGVAAQEVEKALRGAVDEDLSTSLWWATTAYPPTPVSLRGVDALRAFSELMADAVSEAHSPSARTARASALVSQWRPLTTALSLSVRRLAAAVPGVNGLRSGVRPLLFRATAGAPVDDVVHPRVDGRVHFGCPLFATPDLSLALRSVGVHDRYTVYVLMDFNGRVPVAPCVDAFSGPSDVELAGPRVTGDYARAANGSGGAVAAAVRGVEGSGGAAADVNVTQRFGGWRGLFMVDPHAEFVVLSRRAVGRCTFVVLVPPVLWYNVLERESRLRTAVEHEEVRARKVLLLIQRALREDEEALWRRRIGAEEAQALREVLGVASADYQAALQAQSARVQKENAEKAAAEAEASRKAAAEAAAAEAAATRAARVNPPGATAGLVALPAANTSDDVFGMGAPASPTKSQEKDSKETKTSTLKDSEKSREPSRSASPPADKVEYGAVAVGVSKGAAESGKTNQPSASQQRAVSMSPSKASSSSAAMSTTTTTTKKTKSGKKKKKSSSSGFGAMKKKK